MSDDKKPDDQEEVSIDEAITDEILEEAAEIVFLAGERGFDAIFPVFLTWARKQFNNAEGTEDDKLLAVYAFFNEMNNDLKDSFTRGFKNVDARLQGKDVGTGMILMPPAKKIVH
ncbi:MAG: hypothetical protein KAR06_04160 [Deltaproteobacteria bacterium]|nr:hypothetical protein [Deltaproteobacteria bacterium]